MKALKRLLKAGWTIIKWTAIIGGGVLITLKAPAVAVFLGSLPVAAYVADKTRDTYLTMIAGATAGLMCATLVVAAPEVAMLFAILGIREFGRRWSKYIALREQIEKQRARERAAKAAVPAAA